MTQPSSLTQYPSFTPEGLPVTFNQLEALGTGDLSLSVSLRPVPSRTVQLIRSNRYVEMRDLLGDNAAVRRHFEEAQGALGFQVLPVSSRPRVREVTSLPSWVCCFLMYTAVGTTDLVTRDRLTYAVLLLREAMRHGGQGWLEYDRLFRQQAALDANLPWNLIHPGLQATTILGQRTGTGTFCSLCQETDHSAPQCAMAQLQQPTMRASTATTPRTTARRICSSWNEGRCAYPGSCSYRHICSRCFLPSHPARDCRMSSRSGTGPSSNRPLNTPPRSSSS